MTARAQASEEHEAQAQARVAQAETRAEQAEARAARAQEQAAHADERAEQAAGRAARASERAQQAEERLSQAEERLAQVEVQARVLRASVDASIDHQLSPQSPQLHRPGRTSSCGAGSRLSQPGMSDDPETQQGGDSLRQALEAAREEAVALKAQVGACKGSCMLARLPHVALW